MRVWRIASAAHAALDGEGARRHSRRWTPQGIPAVFTWATLSLAALERFVHTDSNIEPTDLLAIPVEIRDDIGINAVDLEALPTGWRAFPAPPALRRLASSGSEHPGPLSTLLSSSRTRCGRLSSAHRFPWMASCRRPPQFTAPAAEARSGS